MQKPRLSDPIRARLRCPACGARLDVRSEQALCTSAACGGCFPVIDGVPVLINEQRSLFTLADFASRRNTTFNLQPSAYQRLLQGVLDLLPDISAAVGSRQNYARFRDLLLTEAHVPAVLVLGGSIEGQGMESLGGGRSLDVVGTDVSFGPLTALVCDAHDIPFDDDTFDGVIAQAVLEHVVDPYRCVEEIHRVLKHNGLVYAETPFMQQVHMGRYDFTRFTHSGHRRLFRRFGEIASGPVCGPGMALAWAYQYFLLSFTSSRVLRGLVRAFVRLTSFHLKYLDHYLVNKTAAFDAASGFYFMGRKDGQILSDRDLLRYYKGSASN
jgi:SAM-dependent methyltransferase